MTELATEPEVEPEEDKEEEEEEESLHDTVSEKLDSIFESTAETIGDTRQAAVGGLSKGNRHTATNETESGYTLDESGQTDGRQTLTQKGAAVGVGHHSKTDTGGIKGQTQTKNETELEGHAGAQWAAAVVTKAKQDGTLEAGIDLLAKAGAFGTARKKLAYRKGRGSASMEAKGSGGAGIEASLKAGGTASTTKIPGVDRRFISDLEAAIQIAVKVGLWADGEFAAQANYGPIEAKAWGEVHALIGADLKMSGRAWVGLTEAGVEWEAEAFAGAKVSGKAGVSVALGPGELIAEVEGEAMAGAEAKTSGNLKIGLKGVSAKAKAEAFAGAKAKVTGTAGFKLRGRTIVSVSGTAEVSAGAGGSVEGEFTIENGVLRFGAGLSAVVGVGAGGKVDAMIDAGSLATIIAADLREMAGAEGPVSTTSPNFERTPLEDKTKAGVIEQIGYDAVIEEFQIYGARKGEQGKNVVKKEVVQQKIKDAAIFHADKLKYLEFDRGIERAAREAFAGQLIDFGVNAGNITAWNVVKGDAAATFKTDSKTGLARQKAQEQLGAELTAYGEKKIAAKVAQPVLQTEVQAIITKHLPALRTAYGVVGTAGDQTALDQGVMEAADPLIERWFDEFNVHQGGLIKRFGVRAPDAVRAEVKDEKADAARGPILASLGRDLETYKAKLVADPAVSMADPAKLNQLYADAVKKAPSAFGSPEGEASIIAQFSKSFDGVISNIRVLGSKLVYSNVERGLKTVRDQANAKAADTARTRAVESFGANLTAYKEKMVAGAAGLSGVFGKARTGLDRAEIEKALALSIKGVDLGANPQEIMAFDGRLKAAAQAALGDVLLDLGIVGGTVVSFKADDAKLAAAKSDRKQNGKKLLTGGQEQDNDRRKLVADLVVPGLQAYGEKLRAIGEKKPASPESMPTEAKLKEAIAKGIKTVRADLLGSPVADKELEWHLRREFPMITGLTVANMEITTIGVNPSYFTQKNEAKAVSLAVQTLVPVVSKEMGPSAELTRGQAQSLIYRVYPAVQGQPGHIVDQALMEVLGFALKGVEVIKIKDAVIEKFVVKKKGP